MAAKPETLPLSEAQDLLQRYHSEHHPTAPEEFMPGLICKCNSCYVGHFNKPINEIPRRSASMCAKHAKARPLDQRLYNLTNSYHRVTPDDRHIPIPDRLIPPAVIRWLQNQPKTVPKPRVVVEEGKPAGASISSEVLPYSASYFTEDEEGSEDKSCGTPHDVDPMPVDRDGGSPSSGSAGDAQLDPSEHPTAPVATPEVVRRIAKGMYLESGNEDYKHYKRVMQDGLNVSRDAHLEALAFAHGSDNLYTDSAQKRVPSMTRMDVFSVFLGVRRVIEEDRDRFREEMCTAGWSGAGLEWPPAADEAVESVLHFPRSAGLRWHHDPQVDGTGKYAGCRSFIRPNTKRSKGRPQLTEEGRSLYTELVEELRQLTTSVEGTQLKVLLHSQDDDRKEQLRTLLLARVEAWLEIAWDSRSWEFAKEDALRTSANMKDKPKLRPRAHGRV